MHVMGMVRERRVQMKRKKMNRPVFVKTLRRGVACSLIPLLFMGICIFVLNLQQSSDQLGSMTINMLATNSRMTDYMMEDLKRSIDNLTRDPTVVDFAMRPYLQDTERNSNLCTQLAILASAYTYVEAGFLYSPKENLSINSHGFIAYGQQESMDRYLQQAAGSMDPYLEIRNPGESGQKLFFAAGIPINSADPQAVIVLQIDLESFLETATGGNAVSDTKRDFFVMDEAGHVLFSDLSEDEREQNARPNFDTSQAGSHLVLGDFGLLRCSVFDNPQLGWKYIYVADALSGESGWFSLVVSLLLSVLASCMVGVLLAYQNSKALYSPLEQLISALPESAANLEAPQDEYQQLTDYYGQLLNQMEETREQAEAVRPLLMKKFLISLADGTLTAPDEILYHIKVLGIPIQEAPCNALLLQIDNYYALPYDEEEKQDIKVQMQAQISTCMAGRADCMTAELSDDTILIISSLGAEEALQDAKPLFRAFAENIRREVESLWPVAVTLALGPICDTVEELPRSCQKAKAALAYKMYRGESSIIDWEEIPLEPHQIYHEFERASQVVTSVRTGDEKGTARHIKELFAEMASQQIPPKQVRDVLQYLISGIGEVVQTVQLPEDRMPQTTVDDAWMRKKTLPELETWLLTVCTQAAARVKSGSSERTRQIAAKIKSYIDKSLTQDISLTSISEYVNYSPTYVSKVFRQYYGTSYIDYVNSSRIKLAQELLLDKRELSAKEIGFQVGFNNLQSFFRIFKKYTGVTPLQWREDDVS